MYFLMLGFVLKKLIACVELYFNPSAVLSSPCSLFFGACLKNKRALKFFFCKRYSTKLQINLQTTLV